ncbi:MAG: NlpC/P60 family protein, partial [Rothia sp. (in: high G+C Gram-positive bacteria)]|nr:NlpC/P60 family protein [Rothia sp. (in: high G+C Gram-positive bacteria)]
APAPAAKSTLQTATGSAKRNAVVAAARGYAAVNAQTDCTMLVTNSLRSAGVNFHGWPADYLQLGHTVSAAQAQPGDLIYYASNGFGSSHIAVYTGNGMAIHGGWNGMGTSAFSAYLPSASAPVFISVDAYNN